MRKIAIILPANLPVPDVLGGAIESSIQQLIDINEFEKQAQFEIFSTFNKIAKDKSKTYKLSSFFYVRKNFFYNIINLFFRLIRKFIPDFNHFDTYLIRKRLIKFNPDKIIFEGSSDKLITLAPYFDKKKIAYYLHSDSINRRNLVNDILVSNCNEIFVVSEYLKNQILNNTNFQEERVKVIKNAIKNSFFDTLKIDNADIFRLREKLNIDKSEFVILFVGRLIKDKGILELIKSVQELPSRINYKLIIIGSFGSDFALKSKGKSDFENEVLNEIRKIRRHVILPGFIHNDDILNYYQIANIVVMPSLCEEAAGKVAMEGMACGKAIICSNGGGLPEYVTNDCGVIVERGDSFTENLSKSIEFLFDNKFLREQMGIKGKLLSSNYMPKRHYFELINLLKN